jgi:hypothetical protein
VTARACWAALGLLAVSACTRSTTVTGSDAGEKPPPRAPQFVDGGPPPDASVTCGETVCSEPNQSEVLGEIACCLPSGECGIRTPLLGNRCSTKAQPGGVDPKCASVTMPNGAVAQGCCSPGGRCGYYDRFGELGCIVADGSDAGVRCEYDPDNMCRSVVAVPCDGPEDCGAGNVCCARSNYGLYDLYGCFKSCESAETTDRGIWLEVCHSRDDCRDSSDTCEPTAGLAPALSICYPSGSVQIPDADAARSNDGGGLDASVASTDAGLSPDAISSTGDEGVACGVLRCPTGRMCCVLSPGESYCARHADGCSCSGPRARDD